MLESKCRLEFFTAQFITDAVVQRLLDAALYEETFAAEDTGLKRKYKDMLAGEGCPFNRLWIVSVSGIDIAVCATLGHPSVNLYVKPPYRRQGIGTDLLKRAIAVEPTVQAVYTPTAEHLYRKHGVPDICNF